MGINCASGYCQVPYINAAGWTVAIYKVPALLVETKCYHDSWLCMGLFSIPVTMVSGIETLLVYYST